MQNTLPNNPGYEVDNIVEHPRSVAPAQDPAVATQMLQVALTALSQRALVAISSLFSVAIASSVFALYWKVLPNPSLETLIGLFFYAWFALSLIYLRYRK